MRRLTDQVCLSRRTLSNRHFSLNPSISSTALIAALGLWLPAHTAHAQSAQPAAAEFPVEEIIVTAQKREQSLQDVPFSIAAMTEDQMRRQGNTNLPELARSIAGLTVQDLGPGQSQVAIRGISAGQVIRDEPSKKEQVGVYLDESVISVALFTPDLDFFDLNRVEVLRGPQGTLFGSGSEAGTIRYITNQPKMDKIEGSAAADISQIDGGGFGWNVKGAVNVPLVEEKVAARAVGYYNHFGGFIDALHPDGSVDKDVNDGKKYGGRLAISFKPTENLTITPRVVYQKLETNGYPREDIFHISANPYTTTRPPVTIGEREQFLENDGEGLTDDFLLFDGTVNADMGSVAFTSITSYTNRDVTVVRDFSNFNPQIFGFTQVGTLTDKTHLDVFSQEMRLASSGEGPFQWVLGGFYIKQKKTYAQDYFVPGFEALFNSLTGSSIDTSSYGAPKDVTFLSDFNFDLRQYSLFGEGSYRITDQFMATVGLRWYDFKENRFGVISGFLNDGPTPVNLRARTTSKNGINPRFILTYDVNDDIQLSAQAAKGFRLGGINDPLIVNICQAEQAQFGDIERYQNESLWNYELGAKTQFLDGHATFNISAFYSDIKDLQVTQRLACSSTVTINVPKARSMGVEAELMLKPVREIDINLSAAYADAELRSTVLDANGNVLPGLQKGNRLPTSPKFQFSGSATYTQPVTDVMDGFLTFSYQYVGSSYTQLSDEDPSIPPASFNVVFGRTVPLPIGFNTKLDSYMLGNLRIGIRTDNWELSAYVNNLWDENAKLSLDRERGGQARLGYLTNQPRTFGLSGRVTF